MKNITILTLVMLMLSVVTVASAEQYTIKTRSFDFTPNDGFLDAGSISNPYVVSDSNGNALGVIGTKTMDFTPGDGFLDAGTSSNPYVLDTDNYGW